jgi:dedicated sortase system histidine kinase
MARLAFRPPRISIRVKLLLVGTALLIIPFIGYRYIQEMGDFLRRNQQETLLSNAQIIAGSLATHPNWFEAEDTITTLARSSYHQYIRDLDSPIQLDGYLEDWRDYTDRMQWFGREHVIQLGNSDAPLSNSFKHQLGRYGKYVYAVFHVKDDKVIYRHPNSYRLDRNDYLQLSLLSPAGELQHYMIATIAPGWINAHLMPDEEAQSRPLRPEVRIKGEWQESRDGYVVEVRIPVSMVGQRIGFAVGDVDDSNKRELRSVISTVGEHRLEQLASVIIPSPDIQHTLAGFVSASTRLWVIDRNARVLGLAGDLTHDNGSNPIEESRGQIDEDGSLVTGLSRLIYRALLQQPVFEFEDDLSSVSRLDSEEITAALSGKPAVRWRRTPDQRVNILTASYPVVDQDKVIGAVAIEKTSNQILLAENRAIEILFNISLLAFAIAAFILLTMATRLASRIRRLRDEAECAIGSDGRVQGEIGGSSIGDELGDLSRSISEMLARITQYNRYLEGMASKLTHELRTPITVVKSSLENLDRNNLTDESRAYVQRATDGLLRLNGILARMSEATRLEQTLQHEQPSRFDLCKVVGGSVEGYRLAYPQRDIRFIEPLECGTNGIPVLGVADLIAQLLDKLVANANDFANPATPIEITLQTHADKAILRVVNQGPPLPEDMQDSLFDSMVSVRSQKGDEPHLGLGLYIVRLITEFHHGRVEALNRNDLPNGESGVEFRAELPVVGT